MSEQPSNTGQPAANALASWGFAASLATFVLTPIAGFLFIDWSLSGFSEGFDDGLTGPGGPSSAQVSLVQIALLAAILAGVVFGLLASISGLARAKKIGGHGHGLALAGVVISSFCLAAFLLLAFGLALS